MDITGSAAPAILVTPRGVTPRDAARAYQDTDSGATGEAAGAGSDFGGMVARALDNVVRTGQHAETAAMQGIAGTGSLTDVVTAVSRAELALQTTTAIRDRVVQAYQDIMKMPI
jgi:flagellar hook-basal body complex protein FliE